jgi:hypothetical protein
MRISASAWSRRERTHVFVDAPVRKTKVSKANGSGVELWFVAPGFNPNASYRITVRLSATDLSHLVAVGLR